MQIKFLQSISEISQVKWNTIVNSDYPFLKHSFLNTLEKSQCVGKQTGWLPFHLIVEEAKKLQAIMPLYLKTDSHGEFIFDWSWADAFYRNGLDYYPKLVSAIPFTPASGPRLCILDESKRTPISSLIKEEASHLDAMISWIKQYDLASVIKESVYNEEKIFFKFTKQIQNDILSHNASISVDYKLRAG